MSNDGEVMRLKGKGKRKADDLDASGEYINDSERLKRAHLEDHDELAIASDMNYTNYQHSNLADPVPDLLENNTLDSQNLSYNSDEEGYYLQDLFGDFEDPWVAIPAYMEPTHFQEAQQLPFAAQAVDESLLGRISANQDSTQATPTSSRATETDEIPSDTVPLPKSDADTLKEGGSYEERCTTEKAPAIMASGSQGTEGDSETQLRSETLEATENDSEPPYQEILFTVELPRAVLADIPAPVQQGGTSSNSNIICTWSPDSSRENMCGVPLPSLDSMYEHLNEIHDHRGHKALKEAKAAQRAKGQKPKKNAKSRDEKWICRLMHFDEKKQEWEKCDNKKGQGYSPRGENVKRHIMKHFVHRESAYENA